MIRIERVRLPAGLRALAHRDPNGDLVIYVSSELDARRQRAAIMEAVRASRRAGWRVAVPGFVALGMARLWMHGAVHAIRAHSAAWTAAAAAAAGVAAVAAIVLVTGPPPHHPAAAAEPQPQPGSLSVPAGPGATRTAPARRRGQVAPPGSGPTTPGGPESMPSGRPSPPAGRPSSAPPGPSPSGSPPPASPTPTPPPPTTQPPSPSPTPTPSPPPKGKKHCVIILGIKVCLSL